MKTKGLVALALLVLCVFIAPKSGVTQPVPAPPTFDGTTLNQGWTPELRKEYYHWPQGTRLIPLPWLLALEQKGSTTPFLDDANIRKWGFIPDPRHSEYNKYGLPVGFAVSLLEDVDKETNKKTKIPMVGWSCAACHTGQIIAKGTLYQIDGAPSMQNNLRFVWALDDAIGDTLSDSAKFRRFANKVFAAQKISTPKMETIFDLRKKLQELHAKLSLVRPDGGLGRQVAQAFCDDPAKKDKYFDPKWEVYPHESWGYGRGDAVGRPSNNFFFSDPDNGHPCNLDTADTPVSIPKVWWAWKHEWVQWNAFVESPVGRNIAEAHALAADPRINPDWKLMTNLHWLEARIELLDPPKWEDVFGPVDTRLAAKGKELYVNGRSKQAFGHGLCAHCHVTELKKNPDNREERTVNRIKVSEIGTDPGVINSYSKMQKAPPGSGLADFQPAAWLQKTTKYLIDMQSAGDKENIPDADRKKMERHRKNTWPVLDAYKAPLHEGVWATAPYLHNGSIPNLYLLLSPQDERDKQAKTFCVGHDQTYDPVNVGFVLTSQCDPIYTFNTELNGNRNIGHEFSNVAGCEMLEGLRGENGLLGCELSRDERLAIIEYLKTLPERVEQSEKTTYRSH